MKVFLFVFILVLMMRILPRFFSSFWAQQPVFHLYDWLYYWQSPGVIDDRVDIIRGNGRFMNWTNLLTVCFCDDNSKMLVSVALSFIQQEYCGPKQQQQKNNSDEEGGVFFPKLQNFEPYFNSGIEDYPSLLSIYYRDGKRTEVDGVITSRVVYMHMAKGVEQRMPMYYVDYLCVSTLRRKQNIAPTIIQTHEYNQRQMSRQTPTQKAIMVSLFKREGQLTGIVPLVKYHTSDYIIDNWLLAFPPSSSSSSTSTNGCRLATKQEVQKIYQYLQASDKQQTTTILSPLNIWFQLIDSGNLWIYVLMCFNDPHEIECAYFFRNSCCYLTQKASTSLSSAQIITCMASIQLSETPFEVFTQGLSDALIDLTAAKNNDNNNMQKKGKIKTSTTTTTTMPNAVILQIEQLGNNAFICANSHVKAIEQYTEPTAYFLYNYRHIPIKPEHCVIIV